MHSSPESLFAAAYAAHYKKGDFHQALILYQQAITEYPESKEAGYAQSQIDIILKDSKFVPDPEASEAAEMHLAAKEEQKRKRELLRDGRSLTISEMLSEYLGSVIAINALDPSKIEAARLIEAQAEYFVVHVADLEVVVPYNQVIRIVRSLKGAISLGLFKGQFSLVIRVSDYGTDKDKAAIGIGFSIGA